MPAAPTPRRVERVRHEIVRREVEVVAVDRPSPGFARITFGGAALQGFHSPGFDDHLKFIFDVGGGEPVRRDYTPLSYDAQRCQLCLEFVLHGHGPATEWARSARPGDRAVIGGPRGSTLVPPDYDWHLLAGDASALPAIARRLGELPAGAQALVIVEMPDSADRRPLHSAAALQVQWVADSAAWLDALRALPLPDGEGFVWCAGEAQVIATARDIVLQDKGHPLAASKLAAYWRRGQADFHEGY